MTYFFFILQIALIYVLARKNTNELFHTARRILRSEKATYWFISLLFFPGTVLHEFSHALTALILLLRVHEIELFPRFEEKQVRLGSVLYEKKDPVRSLLVGVAPIIAGMAFFWIIATFKLFPHKDIPISLLMSYIIFAVSSTMFSSKQDLKDLLIALPILLMIFGLMYVVFGFDWVMKVLPTVEFFISTINVYLLFSIIIHIILLVVLTSLQFIRRK